LLRVVLGIAGTLYVASQPGCPEDYHARYVFGCVLRYALTGGIEIEQVFNAGETLVNRPEKKIARLQSGEK